MINDRDISNYIDIFLVICFSVFNFSKTIRSFFADRSVENNSETEEWNLWKEEINLAKC
jgi:hypothetical protein